MGEAMTIGSLDAILEQMPISRFHHRLILLCGLMFMADGMEVNLLTYLSTCAGEEWKLSDSQRASIISAVFAGQIVGSAFWGPFSDKFGRRIGFLCASSVICSAGFLSALSPSYPWMLFFRTLVGFGVGGAYVPYDLLSEYLPACHRGDYLTRLMYFWTVGSLFVTGLAWISLSSYGWRFLTFMTAIPVTLSCLFSIYYLPESPRWLLVKNRPEDASTELEKLAKECNVELQSVPLSPVGHPWSSDAIPVQSISDHISKDPSYFDIFSSKSSRRLMIPLSMTWGLFGFTYYGVILYVGRLYGNDATSKSEQKSCSFDYESVFLNTSAELVGSFMCILLVDKIGRIKTQTYLYVGGGIAMTLMCTNMPNALALGIIFIARFCIMGASNATWVATPELLPTEIRSTGHAFCNTMTRVGGTMTPFFVDNKRYSLSTIGLVLGALNCAAGMCAFCVPETRGLSLDEASHRQSDEDLVSAAVNVAISGHDAVHKLNHRHHRLNDDEVRVNELNPIDTHNLLHRNFPFSQDIDSDRQL